MIFRLKSCFVVLFGMIVISSCQNSFEKKLVGTYAVHSMKFDSVSVAYTLGLTLHDNGMFDLRINGKNLSGSWSAGDDGDHTWVDFQGAYLTQGLITGVNMEFIEVLVPSSFCCPGVTQLILERESF